MLRKLTWVLVSICLVGRLAASPGFDRHSRSKGLLWGWGHSWGPGWPGWGKTESDLAFVAFHPQMGWFVLDRLELYGEATLLVYHQPEPGISAGLTAFCGRYHFWNHRSWAPYATLGAGLVWTSLDVPEIDRVFNFQVVWGGGVRILRRRGPGWIVEFRNHHISNAGTASRNLGLNAATILAGIEWLR